MLRCYATDTGGRVHSLPALCRIKISRSADVPADSLRVLLFGVYEEEFCRVFVYDEEELIFVAEADEQIARIKENSFTELICRSTAAVLLDNEAKPCNFVNPSSELMFKNYAEPYGFISYSGRDGCFLGDFNVPKGVSCYEVLENFSQGAFGKSVKVDRDEVHFEGEVNEKLLCFSDDGEGLPFTDFTYNRLRCRRLSRIYAKTQVQGEYDTVVSDDDAIKKGVLRQRFMDVSSAADKYLSDAHRALEKSKRSSEEISLVYPGRLTDALGASVCVKFGGKVYEGFEVRTLDYTLDNNSEYTKFTLCRKEN